MFGSSVGNLKHAFRAQNSVSTDVWKPLKISLALKFDSNLLLLVLLLQFL